MVINMRIYDISQELFGGKVYPGDPSPTYERTLQISKGDVCNLTMLQMGAHNATHMDAPYHFYEEGKTIDQIELSKCIGPCTVMNATKLDLSKISDILGQCEKRLLIKGEGVITVELARLFNSYGIVLIGVESQSVGPMDAPMQVHLELLGKEVVLLEGLDLQDVSEGDYFLFAAPLKLGGSDGAPCRAILVEGI